MWTGAHQVLILGSYESCFTVIRYEGLCGSAIIRGLGSLATDLIWTNDTFTSYKNKHSMPALSDTNIFTLYVHNYPPGLPAREYFVFLKATAAFTYTPFSVFWLNFYCENNLYSSWLLQYSFILQLLLTWHTGHAHLALHFCFHHFKTF